MEYPFIKMYKAELFKAKRKSYTCFLRVVVQCIVEDKNAQNNQRKYFKCVYCFIKDKNDHELR